MVEKSIEVKLSNKQKLREIEKLQPELNDKWVVITNGELLAHFDLHEDAINYALENIPKGNRGGVSKVGANRKSGIYKLRW